MTVTRNRDRLINGPVSCRMNKLSTERWSASSASPYVWLDASDSSTITLSGSSVTQWDDKGSAGLDFVQASAGVQPQYGSTTQNGLNTVSFDSDYMSQSGNWDFLHNGTNYMIFAVVKFGATANPDTVYCLFGNNAQASANIGCTLRFDDRSSASRNNKFNYMVTKGTIGSFVIDQLTDDDFITPNTFNLVRVLAFPHNDTAAQRIYTSVNGYGFTTGNTVANAAVATSATYDMQIGAGGNDSSPLVGEIAEIVVFNYYADLYSTKIEGYLSHKWGISSSLPSSHPFRYLPPTV